MLIGNLKNVQKLDLSVNTLGTLDKNLGYSCISWKESCQDSYQDIQEFARSCKIVPRNSRNPKFFIKSFKKNQEKARKCKGLQDFRLEAQSS